MGFIAAGAAPPTKAAGASRLYFAYGTNLNRDEMARRCPDAVPLCPARLAGYRLAFRGRPGAMGVADIEPCPGSEVMGALWELSDRDLAALDRYEGYPGFYGRMTVEVQTDRGPMTALVYRLQPGCVPALPHPRYYDSIARGYRDWGLDPAPLEEARRRTAGELSATPSPGG